ncbi:DUF551 domain-containing protein, partial [Escherichia coli]|nr:DUF551 domain-containing protein [Escherichia coli]EFA8870579.1 DUF551 domain-containing protein [Escherichia coli O45:H2]EFC9409273.1 DUF551 domain-containing protein [Escherichia coli O157:H7]EKF3479200.1 DUF551 domain-containing protein [Escherichia coli O45]ETD58579.1 Eaa protein [Escherichia coli ATCC BAA-2215]EZE69165.1 hypothetical protein BX29_08535 [Escherichia coli O45:H2 str. 2009C-4780]KDV51438.1 hypothetical protein BU54_33190 [Escherichia coli O45:H2 str. 2010C-4211]HEB12274
MTTITKERIELFIKNPLENGLTRGEQMELARIALASLEADPVKRVNSDQMRRVCLEANRHLDKYDAMAKEVNKLLGRIAPPAPVVPEEATPENVEMLSGYVSTYKLTDSERDIAAEIWNACRTAMLQSGNFRESKNSSTNNFREIPEASTSSPVTPALLPGGFTIEEAKELHEDLVRSHISKALSGEKMKKKDRDADLRWIHGVIVQAAWFVKASLEQNALSGNYPVTPDSWISCSERMPDTKTAVLVAREFDRKGDWRMKWATYIPGHPDANDGWIIPGASWKPSHWMPLPEPPQEVRQ